MFNAIALSLAIILSIILIAISPELAAIFLTAVLCFFLVMIFKGRCNLLVGKDDCELWEIYKMKEDRWQQWN